MKTKISYEGPKVHRRIITKADLTSAGIEGLGDDFKDLVWESGANRRPVEFDESVSDDVQKSIIELLARDRTFTISNAEGTISQADPDAGKVNADGSNAATGEGGSNVLAQTIDGGTPSGRRNRGQ